MRSPRRLVWTGIVLLAVTVASTAAQQPTATVSPPAGSPPPTGLAAASQPAVPPAATTQPPSPPVKQPAPPPLADTGGRLEYEPKEVNLGEVWQGTLAQGDITVKNVGSGPLHITDARASCGCTTVTRPKSPLEPGESSVFTVKYDTNHPGASQKTVTIVTNDPAHQNVVIQVHVTVKPVYAATPQDRIVFTDADYKQPQSQSIKLEIQYERPIHLKLRSQQHYGPFDIELTEITPGRTYELKATTRPPLQAGANTASIILDTDKENLPMIALSAMAMVTLPVAVSPQQLSVMSTMTEPRDQWVNVQYRLDRPIRIKEIKASVDSIKWDILPPPPQAHPGARVGSYRLRVTLPGYDAVPPEGAQLEIYTDSEDPDYQKFVVPIRRFAVTPPQVPPPGTPAQLTVTEPTTQPAPNLSKEEVRRRIMEAIQASGASVGGATTGGTATQPAQGATGNKPAGSGASK